ncbi:MAG TPA: SLBB domain-containing protein [Candidatus Acidoferrales bacterium]|nr:SLBB domain-containing protein [Candidatus Acidoferrales bacterium]
MSNNKVAHDKKAGAIDGAFCLRRSTFLCAVLALAGSFSLFGQNSQRLPVSQSELARQNMERVSASVGQLVAILHRDPGIMVELKRWIAKDATEHGQLISDSDLTDEAIFDRLENDIAFRSVATTLVQRYGYLQPAYNPESPEAQQQQFLIRERAKYIAQDEEFSRQEERKERERELQQTQLCDPSSGACKNQNAAQTPSIQALPSEQPSMNQMPGNAPESMPSLPPAAPSAPSMPSNDVASLLRTSGGGSLSEADGTATAMTPPGANAQGQHQESQIDDLSLGSDFSTDASTSHLPASSSSESALPSSSVSDPESTSNSESNSNSPESWKARQDREAISPTQRLVRRNDPYEQIPSLYDMYLQAAARPPAVERFGMQIFQNGTRDLQMIPMDLPVGPDYVLGPGDGISIDLWGGVARRFYQAVDREGRVSLPEVGPLLVAGKSLAEVQQAVQKTLRTQFRDVSADVSLSRLRTIRVYVVGDVVKPGAYDISSLSTPLNALFAAGGPTGRGSLRILKHYRGNDLVQDVDVYDLLLHGVKGNIERLENGDTVMVPPLGPQITIEGMVRRPAIYEQKDEKSLADIIALAGGLLPTATLRHIEVQRIIAHEKQTMLNLDVPANESPNQASTQLDSFRVQDADKIRIFPIDPYTQDAVYLEGHVVRPGKYSFHPGMRVTDLVASYKDLLPEPALQYGEIIRLSAPDYHPTAQSFSVAEALADPAHAPELQALDTVQFFGRYDFENPPSVSVWGDVRAPGTYRTSGDIHISDAIHLAGGLSPDAAEGDAQVFRYMSDSTLKILNVKLSSALDGSPTDDIILHARDRVLIHRNPAAVQPATVYVKGEVARPGRYPLTAEMRVSDLIHAAGGLKPSADTKLADLTQYSLQGDKEVTGQQRHIVLAEAMVNNAQADVVLNNGDVLTIPQVPGWDDLGASISVRGEIVHPGTYGIRPGERLSSVLKRAGGFSSAAYPYGAVLLRSEVQRLEQRSYGELMQRVREQQTSVRLTAASSADPDQKASAESALVQWQSTLDNLMSSPPSGRVTIQISSNLKDWEDTSRDITVRAGDVLVVPKRPSYVLVQGQVYGATAVAYRPGKSAKWYLMQAGGTTNMANKKATFVIRANGTVVGSHSSFWVSGEGLNVALQPGDMVVVPEKALGGPPVWKAVFQNAQVMSSIATSAILAAAYF